MKSVDRKPKTAAKRSLLGEILIQNNWLRVRELEEGLNKQKADQRLIGEILVDSGSLTQSRLYQGLAIQYGKRFVNLRTLHIEPEVIQRFPKEFVSQYRIMPLAIKEGILLVASANPTDMWPLMLLQSQFALREVRFVLATSDDIEDAIQSHYASANTKDS